MNNRRQSSFANLNAPDWLWYFLKRVPPEKALLRAMEARFVEQAHLGQPCLDLRNEYGEHQALPPRSADLSASAVLIGTGDATPSFETLREISQRMRTSGKLLVTVPATDLTDESAATWTKLLNQAGFHIDRWHPFYDDSAQDASSAEAHNWSDVLYELTGHHALPWIRILNPIHTVLRPHYENRTSTEGNCLFILASKAEQTPVQQTLPAASPWQVIDEQTKALTAHHLQGDDATASQTVRQANTPVSYLPARRFFPSSKLFLSALAFGATMLAQLSMRSTPDRMGSGVVWLILALGAIFGLSRSSAETNSNFQQTLSKWVRTLPFTQITTVSASIVVSAIAYAQAERPMIALPLWLIAIISTGTTLFRFTSDVPPNTTNDEPSKLDNDEASTIYSRLASLKGYILPLILFVALFLRVYQLTAHPWVINGAEAQLGLDAIYTQNVFGTAWLSNPTLPLFLTKLTVAIFGRTPLALRLFAPLIGTATVYAIYQVGKRLWDEKVGLVAAILLAGSHFHLHYSRIGLTNIWDSLLALCAMGGIAVAWHSEKRNAWLGAGLAIGLSAYVFTSAHLLPLMLIPIFVVALLFHRETLLAQGRHIVSATSLALVTALPQTLFFNARPHLFMERVNLLGIQRNGWLAAEALSRNLTEGDVFRQQLWQAAMGFTAMLDKDDMYGATVPLIGWLTGTFFLLGVGMALYHFRQMRYTVLITTIVITVIFGGALLVEAPHSRRYLIALPAVFLLAARALVWLIDTISTQSRSPLTAYRRHFVLLLATALALLDTSFYFRQYQSSHLFADRNTELAHEMADYLNELEGDWTAYFHGAPAMYVSFSTLPFLANGFEGNINLFDVVDPTVLPAADSPNVVHIFVPERLGEIETIREIRPNGTTTQIDGFKSSPLFLTYESTP